MQHNLSYSFRISKYDNRYRSNHAFFNDEWTSVGDIGKVFNGKVFTRAEYERVENSYLSVVKKICFLLNIVEMQITGLEDYSNKCIYYNGIVLEGIDAITCVARDCLREKYWCKLSAPELEFHFGYDYYLYVCSPLNFEQISDLVHDLGLFVEIKESPYLS